MKAFKKWWDKDSMEGDWDYEHYAAIGWERALEWVKSRSDKAKNLYMIDVNELDDELGE